MFEVPTTSSITVASFCTFSCFEKFHSLVNRSLWQVAPNNLKRFVDFGDCFWLCFKLAVSLEHCTPHAIVYWVYTVSQKNIPDIFDCNFIIRF